MKRIILFVFLTMFFQQLYTSNQVDENCTTNCPHAKAAMIEKKVSNQVKEITAPQVLQKIELIKAGDTSIKIVNVLGKKYYDDAHIPYSESAPLKDLSNTARGWDKNQEIIVYCACRECDASMKAATLLINMGFKNVVAYEGGIREWFQSGYECVGLCAYSYLKEKGDSRHIVAMRDCPLKKLLIDIYCCQTI